MSVLADIENLVFLRYMWIVDGGLAMVQTGGNGQYSLHTCTVGLRIKSEAEWDRLEVGGRTLFSNPIEKHENQMR